VSASEHGHKAPSVLSAAARHETALMTRIAAAEQDAQRRTGQAHEQAAALLIETQHRTERDIAEMRRQAAVERERVEAAIADEAGRKVAEIRAKAAPNLDRIRRAVVGRILPSAAQKGDANV
jgi:vacuolar-type H+-ATPase subunit H